MRKTSFIWQYVPIVLGVIVTTIFERTVVSIGNGLLSAPYILIVTSAVLLSEYMVAIFSIVLGTIALYYVQSPNGIHLNLVIVFRLAELLIVSIIIYVLGRKLRIIRQSNESLFESAQALQNVIVKLRGEAKGKSKEMAKLNTVNKELEALVKQFLDDSEYWNRDWSAPEIRFKIHN